MPFIVMWYLMALICPGGLNNQMPLGLVTFTVAGYKGSVVVTLPFGFNAYSKNVSKNSMIATWYSDGSCVFSISVLALVLFISDSVIVLSAKP